MGRVCNSSCPYYGVDANYDGYCKKDYNSYRDRGSACNMESSSTASSSSSSSSSSTNRKPRTCNSSCPYYGVDANYDGYCKKDHNSYRDRGSTCNIGETVPGSSSSSSSSYSSSSSSSSSSGGGCGCGIAVIVAILIIAALVIPNVSKLFGGKEDAPTQVTVSSEEQVIAYTTASSLNLRKGPSTSDAVVTSMPKNSKVFVEKIEGSWAYVKYKDVKGWCSTKYLNIQD